MKSSVVVLPCDAKTSDLLMWVNPIKSGIIFGSVSAVYLAMWHYEMSFLTMLCSLISLSMAVFMGWSRISALTGRQGPPLPAFISNGISDSQFNKLSDKVHKILNKSLSLLGVVLAGKDVMTAGKINLGLLFAAWLFSKISLFAMLYTVFFMAFTFPKVYELKKEEIDKVIVLIQEKYKYVNDTYISKIPHASETKARVEGTKASGMKKMADDFTGKAADAFGAGTGSVPKFD